ncbi:MAG: winged helix-turn-helix domain-containing protein [Chitinophagaceae bacterium]
MEQDFKNIAALIGDPTRALVLWTLLDGKAFTATELAIAADTTAQNISMHLQKLVQADLLVVESQGRHRYYRFARKEVAYAVEALANLIPPVKARDKRSDEDNTGIRYCRTCYDHLAGKIGVALSDSLLRQKILQQKENEFVISKKGNQWLLQFGIDTEELQQQRRTIVRPCLDWSERRYHIAGAMGAALLNKMLQEDWLRRTKNSRMIVITANGEKQLHKHFQITI